jgi:hypothetical protein
MPKQPLQEMLPGRAHVKGSEAKPPPTNVHVALLVHAAEKLGYKVRRGWCCLSAASVAAVVLR